MLGLASSVLGEPFNLVLLAIAVIGIFLATVFITAFWPKDESSTLRAYLKFFYACFVKPHTGDGNGNQQDALVLSHGNLKQCKILNTIRRASTKHKRMFMMRLEQDSSKVVRIC
jgi:hypothetical protein